MTFFQSTLAVNLIWVILGVLIILVGLYREKQSIEVTFQSNRKRRFVINLVWVILGALVILVGLYRENLYREEDNKQKSEIIKSQKIIIDLQKGQIESQRTIIDLQQKVNVATEEIANLQRTTAQYISGGDSFCIAAFAFDETKKALLGLIHKGKYPLYDLTVRITDVDDFQSVPHKGELSASDFIKLSQRDTVIQVGTLTPNHTQMFVMGRYPTDDSKIRYNIYYSARNGDFTQIYRSVLINGKRVTATEISSGVISKGKVLYKKVDAEYPRDESGRIKW